MQITAAVARHKEKPLTIETLDLEEPRPDEVLVRIVGVGICHTDVKAWQQVRPVPLPVVLGHEGAGIVEKVGSQVRKVAPGDSVVLSYHSCGICGNCQQGHAAYCEQVYSLNFGGKRLDGTTTLHKGDEIIHSPFFGQSSFASYALASERNVTKVPDDVPLELLGPLGCGIQTGAGAVMNSLRVQPGSSIAIFGVGSVGLSAVMAALVSGCTTIIAVDVQNNRLDLARELGATHTINPQETDPVEEVHRVQPGGVDYALDTSGKADVFQQAVRSIRIMGTCGLIGGMAPSDNIQVEANHLLLGRTVRGIIQGDSIPDIFIPRLIKLYQQGRFPIDRLVTYYELDEINQAIADMRSGRVIKPVLRL